MSMEEADAKFPGQHANGIPPSPTRENPGQVYPHSDPNAGTIPGTSRSNSSQHLIGNPFLMRAALGKLDKALGDVIEVVEREKIAQGGTESENLLVKKFRTWQTELDEIRAGHGTPERSRPASKVRPEHEGGMFTD
ncbi:hypothetical protein Moror_14509 [Moniliophthora roreri MCA 2997]|uniref:Uncharacterized protein n=1 Tax=Moniliophthora roreri (strain MCA 2997) TaxID=1381753 RepID=V2X2G2_MONRO|nr:hypothetical protein Moror_14509 [Moniliophthora roreri MCA 2997]